MKIFLLTTLFAFTLLVSPSVTRAAVAVDFETTPLFGAANFLPGDTVIKTVAVTNTGDGVEQVQTKLYNVIDGGLADMVTVDISSGGTLFAGSFDDFDNAGELFLSTLSAGDTIVYTFAMSFAPESGNDYQNKSLGFDICIGFKGGELSCDKIDDSGYSQGSYGGGGYSQGSYGGGGYSQGSYGGGGYSQGSYNEARVGGVSQRIPRVLGEQTSVIPVGAPNTGYVPAENLPIVPLATLFLIFIFVSRKMHVR